MLQVCQMYSTDAHGPAHGHTHEHAHGLKFFLGGKIQTRYICLFFWIWVFQDHVYVGILLKMQGFWTKNSIIFNVCAKVLECVQ